MAAIRSATGPAYMMPSIPTNNGKIIISGSKNKICLVKDNIIPLVGLPIAVKKLDEIGCKKIKKVKNKKIFVQIENTPVIPFQTVQ